MDDEQELLVELLKQIKEVGWDKHLQRVTRMWDVGPAGHFRITFKTTKLKEIIEEIWNAKVKEGRLGYELIDENPQREFARKLDRHGGVPQQICIEPKNGDHRKGPIRAWARKGRNRRGNCHTQRAKRSHTKDGMGRPWCESPCNLHDRKTLGQLQGNMLPLQRGWA